MARPLDNEILDLVDENEIEEEIGFADEFKVKVCTAITDSTKVIETKQPAAVSDTDRREVSSESATPTTLASVPIRVPEDIAVSPKVKLFKLDSMETLPNGQCYGIHLNHLSTTIQVSQGLTNSITFILLRTSC